MINKKITKEELSFFQKKLENAILRSLYRKQKFLGDKISSSTLTKSVTWFLRRGENKNDALKTLYKNKSINIIPEVNNKVGRNITFYSLTKIGFDEATQSMLEL